MTKKKKNNKRTAEACLVHCEQQERDISRCLLDVEQKGPSPLGIGSQSAQVEIRAHDALTILSEHKNQKEQRAIIKRCIQIESGRMVVQA